MRAITFLCLLGAAVAIEYDWYGVTQTAEPESEESEERDSHQTEPDNTGNVCLMDNGSCGCCVMQKQMNRMEQFFNLSLSVLENDLQRAERTLNECRDSRCAFSVSLGSTGQNICAPPRRERRSSEVAIYRHVFTNLGNGYNSTTGVFRAPFAGVYVFAVTAYNDAGAPESPLALCASLIVNSRKVTMTGDTNSHDQEDSATMVAIVRMEVGETAWVEIPALCQICDMGAHYNTFNGFRIYA